MKSETDLATTSDERVMAAIAHLLGVVGALIVWALQKDKSPFVRFQAIQALAFDLAIIILNMAFMVCLMSIMFLGMLSSIFTLISSTSTTVDPYIFFPATFPFLIFLCLMPFSIVTFMVRLYAAFSVASGRDFRYPWLGQRVHKFLE